MAVKVHIKNFQSLRDVRLEIDGLTVVTGTNNAGKTAMFRAISGAFSNLRGSNFVRYGESHASVDVAFQEGGRILWEKGKNVNRYTVWDAQGEEMELDKVHHGPPQEVMDFGVRPIRAGKSEFWPQIAEQLTGVVFLFNQSGPIMAEAVADVERVGLLTKALRISESDARQAKTELKIRKKDLKETEARIDAYKGVDAVNARARELECLNQEYQRLGTQIQALREVHKKLHTLKSFIAAVDGVENLDTDVADALVEAVDTSRRLETLCALQTQLQRARKAVLRLQFDISTDRADILSERLEEVSGAKRSLKSLKSLAAHMDTIRAAVSSDERGIQRLKGEVADLRGKLSEMIAQEQPCVECGRPLDDKVMEILR